MKYMKQLSIILAISLLGEIVVRFLPIGFPANIMAMIILLVLLLSKKFKEEQIKEAADFLMENMGIFIIPLAVMTLDHVDALAQVGVQLVLMAIVMMVISMLVTAYTIRLCMFFMKKNKKSEVNG